MRLGEEQRICKEAQKRNQIKDHHSILCGAGLEPLQLVSKLQRCKPGAASLIVQKLQRCKPGAIKRLLWD